MFPEQPAQPEVDILIEQDGEWILQSSEIQETVNMDEDEFEDTSNAKRPSLDERGALNRQRNRLAVSAGFVAVSMETHRFVGSARRSLCIVAWRSFRWTR